MSDVYNIKDYRTTHFEYNVLDKIHGQPTIDTVSRILRQVKRNAQKVQTALGGGQLGYLALCISAEVYNNLPNSALFIRPVRPDPFQLEGEGGICTRNAIAALLPAEIAEQKASYDLSVRQYNECQAVEQALRTQIVEAVPDEYLDPLRNPDTDMIHDSIPDIINYLTTNFCRMTEEELNMREDEVKNFAFDPEQPVEIVFNKIKAFQDVCTMTRHDKTDRQLVGLAYLIFNKTRAYTDALKVWNAKPEDIKTYMNMKIHMRAEYHALRQVGALTVADSSLNMMKQLTEQQNTLAQEMHTELNNTMQANFLQAFNMIEKKSEETIPAPPSSSANAMQIPQEFMQLLTSLQAKVEALSNPGNTTPYSQTNTNINPVTKREYKRYCWSCGCCPHWGRSCGKKKTGHKDDATFKNRMGGSNEKCLGPKS